MQRRGDIPDRWMTSNLGTGQRGHGRAAQTDAEEEPLGWSPTRCKRRVESGRAVATSGGFG